VLWFNAIYRVPVPYIPAGFPHGTLGVKFQLQPIQFTVQGCRSGINSIWI
jgi:hypothetical protein